MRCQIPGCKDIGVISYEKDGIFQGIHLENVMIWACRNHLTKEVDDAILIAGEEASNLMYI